MSDDSVYRPNGQEEPDDFEPRVSLPEELLVRLPTVLTRQQMRAYHIVREDMQVRRPAPGAPLKRWTGGRRLEDYAALPGSPSLRTFKEMSRRMRAAGFLKRARFGRAYYWTIDEEELPPEDGPP